MPVNNYLNTFARSRRAAVMATRRISYFTVYNRAHVPSIHPEWIFMFVDR